MKKDKGFQKVSGRMALLHSNPWWDPGAPQPAAGQRQGIATSNLGDPTQLLWPWSSGRASMLLRMLLAALHHRQTAGAAKPRGYFSCHRITEWWGLEATSVDHVVQTLCWTRVTYSRLHRTSSRRVLNISRKGDSTTSLGSLFQCSVTLRGKKFFLMFRPAAF